MWNIVLNMSEFLNKCWKILLILSVFPFSIYAQSFKPVSINDFFKKYEKNNLNNGKIDETSQKIKSPNSGALNLPVKNSADNKPESVVKIAKYNENVKALKFPVIDVLVINRILNNSKIIQFKAGQTQRLANIFDVTIRNCIQRKTEFQKKMHNIDMQVIEHKDSKTLKRYDDIFYLEMPGFRAFEDVAYDIKPLKCSGKPHQISLKKADKLYKSINTQRPEKIVAENKTKLDLISEQKIEAIINNKNIDL